MGAPDGNTNGQTTGISRLLTVGQFPKGCAYLRRSCQLLKGEIEADLTARGVAIGLREKAAINAACLAEGVRLLLWRYLRRCGGDDADGYHEPDGNAPIASDGDIEPLSPANAESDAIANAVQPKAKRRSRSRLSIMQRVSVIDRMMRALEQRDAALAKLGIVPAAASAAPTAKPDDPLAYLNAGGE